VALAVVALLALMAWRLHWVDGLLPAGWQYGAAPAAVPAVPESAPAPAPAAAAQ